MKGQGKVILLRYAVGSESTEQREKGFTDTLAKDFPGISLLSDTEYAGPTSDSAQQKAQSLVTRYRGQGRWDLLRQRVEYVRDVAGPRWSGHAGRTAVIRRSCEAAVLLEMRDVTKSFGATRALDGVSLEIDAGRSPCLDRRKRGRQEHAHEGPFRAPIGPTRAR